MNKKFLRIFLLLAALFFVVRIIFYRQIADTAIFKLLILDSDFYFQWAKGLATGHGNPPGPFWLSPLYPYFMYGVFSATGSLNVNIVVIIQFLLSLGTLILLVLFTRRLFGDAVALVTTALAAFYAPWVYFDGVLLTSSLILFLNAGILYLLVTQTDLVDLQNSKPETQIWVWIGIGVLTGLSALARPSVLIFAVLLIIWLVWKKSPPLAPPQAEGKTQSSFKFQVSSLLRPALFLAAIIVVLVPVLIRNWVVAGSPVLTTSSGGINFFIGNRAGASGMYDEFDFINSFDPWRESEGFRAEAVKRTGHEMTLTQASRYWMGQALDDIVRDPLNWIALVVKKTWLTLQREEIPTNISFRGVAGFSPILGVLPLRWGLLLPLAVGGIYLLFHRKHPARRLFIYYLAAYLLTNIVFFSASEYRYPMILLLLPVAAYLLVSLWNLVELKQVRELLIVCGIYIVALVIVNLPSHRVATATSPKGDYTNMGTVARDYGMIAESIPLFARALVIDNDWQNARLGLAQSLWSLGNFDDARREFEMAGVEPPDSVSGKPLQDFFDNLWQYTEDDDYKGGLAYLDSIFPGDHDAPAEVWSARALIEDQLGMSDRARDALLKAADKDPQNPDFPYHAGLLTAGLGDSLRAEQLYEQAIERYRAYVPARLELGLSALRRGDLETAREQVSELQRIRIPSDSVLVQKRFDELQRRLKIAEGQTGKQ